MFILNSRRKKVPKLLSIVTICFNEKEHIVETMDSVLKQTLQDYEYLILDGESTDGTVELIKNHIVHNKKRTATT